MASGLPVIRRIQDNDCALCAAIDAAVFSNPWTESQFSAELEHAFSLGCMAIQADAGEHAGYILGRIVAGEVEILRIAVASRFQRQGLGTRLYTVFLSDSRIPPESSVFLEVNRDNIGAIAFYKKLGFKELYTRKGYYAGKGDACVMVSRNTSNTGRGESGKP
jgi:ribosomal-protein-alanine N-acetyltransferase